MYYYLYEVKNNINGMIYVGIHKTKKLDDGYMGSGKIILNAIKKLGKEKFTKTIIAYFDCEEDMRNAEKEYVNEDFIKRPDVYNIVLGGGCGWQYVNEMGIPKRSRSPLMKEMQSQRMKENYPESLREAVRKGAQNPKSETQKKKAAKFYDDKILIYHELIGKKWAKEENLVLYLDQGWVLGKSPKMMKPKNNKTDRRKSGRKFADAVTIEKYNMWHAIYKDVGFTKFCELTGYANSSPNLIQLFNRYVKDFKPFPGNRSRK
jgi:hypothetical protein